MFALALTLIKYLSLLILPLTAGTDDPLLFTLSLTYWPSTLGIFFLVFAESLVLVLFLRALPRSYRTCGSFVLVLLLLLFISVATNSGFLYYSYFGVFPDREALSLLLVEEESLIYLGDAAFVWALVVLFLLSGLQASLYGFITSALWRRTTQKVGLPLAISVIALAVYVGLYGFMFPIQDSASFPFLRHSFPEFALADELMGSSESIDPVALLNSVPEAPLSSPTQEPGGNLRHVILIILECVRPDYIPLYNPEERRTMPLLAQSSTEWLALTPPYAHGPDSETAIPILMTSNHSAGLRRQPTGVFSETWQAFSNAGVETAFFSAGSLSWAGLRGRLGLSQVDTVVGRADLSEEELKEVDSAVLSHWARFLGQNKSRRTFSTVHLVGTHFPYAGLSDDRSVYPLQVENLKNYYRLSLTRADGYLSGILDELESMSLKEDAVVFVTADHGEGLGDHNALFHSSSVFEEIVRVPLLVRIEKSRPELIRRLQAHADEVRGHIDIVPTVFDLFGIESPKSAQGTSLFLPNKRKFEVITGAKFFALSNGVNKILIDIRNSLLEAYNLESDPEEEAPLLKRLLASSCPFYQEADRQGWELLKPSYCWEQIKAKEETR